PPVPVADSPSPPRIIPSGSQPVRTNSSQAPRRSSLMPRFVTVGRKTFIHLETPHWAQRNPRFGLALSSGASPSRWLARSVGAPVSNAPPRITRGPPSAGPVGFDDGLTAYQPRS